MSKNRSKPRRKATESKVESQSVAATERIIAHPPRPNGPLLIVSSVLVAAWLLYLLVVALVY